MPSPTLTLTSSASRPPLPIATLTSFPLHSFAKPFLCPCCQHVVDNEVCGLNGHARCASTAPELAFTPELTLWTAKPSTALLPYRAGSAAFLSSTSSNSATPMQKPGLVAGNPGTPPPMKQARREVPLPSQEGNKGVVQYAL